MLLKKCLALLPALALLVPSLALCESEGILGYQPGDTVEWYSRLRRTRTMPSARR